MDGFFWAVMGNDVEPNINSNRQETNRTKSQSLILKSQNKRYRPASFRNLSLETDLVHAFFFLEGTW
ncbi:hypothetical protein MKX01_041919 [Papaver californicum]|nr:hypothetical protein MKX01_041919 [Papaver californicum]